MESERSLTLAENPVITESHLVAAAVEKGHGDGSIDTELPARWVDNLLWATPVAGRQIAEESGSRHRALSLVLTTMRRVVGKTG